MNDLPRLSVFSTLLKLWIYRLIIVLNKLLLSRKKEWKNPKLSLISFLLFFLSSKEKGGGGFLPSFSLFVIKRK